MNLRQTLNRLSSNRPHPLTAQLSAVWAYRSLSPIYEFFTRAALIKALERSSSSCLRLANSDEAQPST
jgi:hypothetical protein